MLILPPAMTKESKIYLDFFRMNFPLLLLPALIFGGIAGLYQNQRPSVDHLNGLLEMSHEQRNVLTQIQLTDQAVSLLREVNIQKQLGIDGVKVQVYKPGPLLLAIDVSAAEERILESSLAKLQAYAKSRFPFEQRGDIVRSSRKDSVILWIGYGAIFGAILGLLISLAKTYFQKY